MMEKGRNRRLRRSKFRKNDDGGSCAPQNHAAAAVAGHGRRGTAGRGHWNRFGAGRLAGAAGQGDRALSAGRRRRHRQPHPLRQARRRSRPAIRHRQPRRRRRHHRRGGGGESGARRLHHPVRRHRLLGEPVALSAPALRHGQRFPAGVPGVAGAQPAGGASVGSGQDRRRRHRHRQGGAGRARLGLVGQRHRAAPLARAVPAADRRQAQPHSLPRRRPGAERPDRRPGEVLLLERRRLHRSRPGRRAQGHRPYRPRPARHAARPAGGSGDACGLRGL